MRKFLLAVCIASMSATVPATAQVSVGYDAPGVSIGLNIGTYPQLELIPGYPVYYAPQLGTNYFFYDGMYWVYDGENWYTSAWYDGPWELVAPVAVPLYILRVPVRYYRRPPLYFRTWAASAPPHWGEHWGSSWEQRRRGWDRWDRSVVQAPAPLPTYQRQYSGNRYPQVQQQQALQEQHYRYRPRDAVAQQYYQRLQASTPSDRGRVGAPPQGQPAQSPAPVQAQRGRGENTAEQQARQRQAQQEQRAQQQTQQRQAQQEQRVQQQTQQREAGQAQRGQQQAQQQAQQRQAEQARRGQLQAQQRQAEQAQRVQQQTQQRQAQQAPQAQRAQQQTQQRQAEQAQHAQQQAQQRQAEQAQHAQQQAQQRQTEQARRGQQQPEQRQREQNAQQARGQERKEQGG